MNNGVEHYEDRATRNIYAELIALRDAQRNQRANAMSVVRGKQLPRELNPQGLMRWYLAPTLFDTAIRTEIIARQEIPPGSRSGRQRTQGGQIIFVLEGRGYTTINGERFDWKPGDMVTLPLLVEGVEVQHVNGSDTERAELLLVEPNLVDAVGVDRGCGFEQLEPCPEFADGD